MKLKSILLYAIAISLSACATSPRASALGGVKPYPLKVCLVTGNDLGSMGDEQRFVYQGQEMKFCCEPCKDKFLKNPAKYLTKLP
jgi:hypothetical protein